MRQGVHRASRKWLGFERAVATLERNIVLREEQRQELITLI
jgi:hypothetical protein